MINNSAESFKRKMMDRVNSAIEGSQNFRFEYDDLRNDKLGTGSIQYRNPLHGSAAGAIMGQDSDTTVG